MDFDTRLIHSGVGSIPSGMRLHFSHFEVEPRDVFEKVKVCHKGAERFIVAESSAKAL